MGNTSSIRTTLENSNLFPPQQPLKVPNEGQYDQAGAYSIVAYKNQAEGSKSDLDVAKLNFENNYKKFLILYGQYSNAPLREHPTQNILKYPLTEETDVFKNYPNLKPKINQF
jgi:hypothetical protein